MQPLRCAITVSMFSQSYYSHAQLRPRFQKFGHLAAWQIDVTENEILMYKINVMIDSSTLNVASFPVFNTVLLGYPSSMSRRPATCILSTK